MALTITHSFVSAVPDGGDTTLVQPSNWNAAHVLTGTLPASSVAAAGSSGQVQFNSSGALGAMSGTSWNDTNRSLTLTGATVTTSNPVLNLSQTWNAGGVTFTGLLLNVTNTASASGSLLMDLQVGSTSVFSVSQGTTAAVTIIGNTNNRAVGPIVGKSAGGANTGTALTLDATDNTGGHSWSFISTGSAAGGGAGNFGFYDGTLGQYNAYISNAGGLFIQFPNNAFIGWSSGSDASSPADTGLWRDAVSVIAQRNSTNAQTLRIYNTYSGGGSNYERGVFDWGTTSNVLTIGTQAAGTGSSRNMQFLIGGTNASFLMGSGASSVTPTLAVVSSTGMAVALLCGTNASAFCFDSAGVFWVMPDTHANIIGNTAGSNNPFFEIDTSGNATLGSTGLLGWSNSAQNARATLSDLALGRNGAASLRLGAADAASAVAQTLGVQSVAAGHTNTAGANFTIAGSLSNGSGASGDIIIQTGDTGAASGTQNAFNTALTIKGGAAAGKSGSIVIGSAAIATNATDGFLYIPTCAGTPTGAPTAFTGRVAMVYDTTNNKFYIYNGAWKGGTNPGAFT